MKTPGSLLPGVACARVEGRGPAIAKEGRLECHSIDSSRLSRATPFVTQLTQSGTVGHVTPYAVMDRNIMGFLLPTQELP